MILSVDPGENVGVAKWSDEGDLLYNETVRIPELCTLLDNQHWGAEDFEVVVAESFRLRQGKQMAQTGSRMAASRVLGMCELFAHLKHAEFVEQPPEAYKMAAMHFGIKLPKGHVQDRLSARLHGLFYMEDVGLITPSPLW